MSNSVKSYANAEVSLHPKPLSQISSIHSTWSYTLTGDSLVCDVSYDMFTSKDPTATLGGDYHDYEVMVWLAQLGGAAPIADHYNPDGTATVTAGNVPLAGDSWNLYSGTNKQTGTKVFSFIAVSQVNDFKGDLMDFFHYLEKSQGLPSSQNLVYVAAGMEPFT